MTSKTAFQFPPQASARARLKRSDTIWPPPASPPSDPCPDSAPDSSLSSSVLTRLGKLPEKPSSGPGAWLSESESVEVSESTSVSASDVVSDSLSFSLSDFELVDNEMDGTKRQKLTREGDELEDQDEVSIEPEGSFGNL